MSSQHEPQDEPFSHESLMTGHRRGDSSANLLQSESVPLGEDHDHSYGDGFYDHAGPSNATLYDDPERVSLDKEGGAGGAKNYENFEYADDDIYNEARARPVQEKATPFSRFLRNAGVGQRPLNQRIDEKKRGIGRQRYPFVSWTLAVVMLAVLIYELVLNSKNQGTPISFHPVVNPMLGPSQSALINAGARYPPCMKDVAGLPLSTRFPCLNDTANPPDQLCSLEDVCGFGGFHGKDPDQWFRFITPIFLHAGIIHFLLNMLAQLTASAEVEKEMGSIGFIILYLAAGIFGNVLGGNFALVAAPSIGASGAIFGTVAVAWVDLVAHWQYQYRPVRKLVFMVVELVVGIAIGYIPYVDNFAHIGGFLMGLLVGVVLYPVISTTKRHRIVVWAFRLAAIPLAIVLFVVLIRNFYKSDPYAACSWCRYLSCFPTSSNNHCQGTGFTTNTTGTSI
ncbi:rhomboid family intramembrane serine protease [Phanerochaete sordida]|uniref:Rhomboid-type serine protease n=1 Tax=Phanerochaete sordida TaxID=48140 RepID=A0A9P3L849_9APHY|nr:rhomboid family intramembrane serine protease [Phanerochaete sordida]